ncbi:MAG: nicotinate (nicotinamide) nucleotide adenylyltransferase [Dysgonomonas sp.]
MNIGIFSGSFDPVHIGHMIIANYITEFTDIDEIWFLISPQNPFKKDNIMTDELFRLQMVQLAVEEYTEFKASDFEFTLPQPSYTINTLQKLKEKYPKHTFSLIIGGDNWEAFDKWKDHESIIADHHIYVYPRLDYSISVADNLKDRVTVLDSPIIEISSTFIRKCINEGKTLKRSFPTKCLII